MRLLIILFLATIVLISCKNKTQNTDNQITKTLNTREIQEEYDIKINYKKLKEVKSKQDVVAIFFETNFNNDFVEVFVDGNLKLSDTISSDPTLGLAKELELGNFSEINEVSFRINNGRDVIIRDIEYNFLFVGYIKDSIVDVELKNSFLGYL